MDQLVSIAPPSRPSTKAPPVQVALVRTAKVTSASTWSSPVTPPLGLAYMAATLLAAGHRVQAVDALAESVDQFIEEDGLLYQGLTIQQTVDRVAVDAQLIGVTCMFTQEWPYVRRVIQALRQRFPRAVIVAGGEHVSALPEYCLRDCPALDFCAMGEGEETIVEAAGQLAYGQSLREVPGLTCLDDAGNYYQAPQRQRIREVDAIPRPAWDLFPMEAYLTSDNVFGVYRGRSMPILATRGCPYKCTFCSNLDMYGQLWVPRDPGDVLDEIEDYIHRYGAENIDFYDLTMVIRRQWTLEFCRLIEERGLRFTWQLPSGTRSEAIDEEVAAALYRTGCRNIGYSPESGSPRILKSIKKQVDLGALKRSIRGALRNKIRVRVNLIYGFPQETRRDLALTAKLAAELAVAGVHDVDLGIFSPYPGTDLFRLLRTDGTIPALNDRYFRTLLALRDPTQPASYCKAVGGFELQMWRVVTMAVFYAMSFTFRPIRLLRVIGSLFSPKRKRETTLENRLTILINRPRPKRGATQDAGLTAVPQVSASVPPQIVPAVTGSMEGACEV